MDLLYRQGQRFDLVFADPPYNKGWAQKILAKLAKSPLLADGGWLIVEHSMHDTIAPAVPEGYEIFRSQQYGETVLTFIRAKREESGVADCISSATYDKIEQID